MLSRRVNGVETRRKSQEWNFLIPEQHTVRHKMTTFHLQRLSHAWIGWNITTFSDSHNRLLNSSSQTRSRVTWTLRARVWWVVNSWMEKRALIGAVLRRTITAREREKMWVAQTFIELVTFWAGNFLFNYTLLLSRFKRDMCWRSMMKSWRWLTLTFACVSP